MQSNRTYGDFTVYKDYGHEVGVTWDNEQYENKIRNSYSAYYRWSNDFIGIGYKFLEESWHLLNNILLELVWRQDARLSIANSYRLPTLYEQRGDGWVIANPSLQPEEGVGTEFGYKDVSIYYYEFEEGIDFDYNRYQYVNSGAYSHTELDIKTNFCLTMGLFSCILST